MNTNKAIEVLQANKEKLAFTTEITDALYVAIENMRDTKNRNNKTLAMMQDILDCNYGDVDDDQVYDVLVNYVGMSEIIRYKRKKEYDLNDKEINYLVGLMKD